jgi:hypothetical protein
MVNGRLPRRSFIGTTHSARRRGSQASPSPLSRSSARRARRGRTTRANSKGARGISRRKSGKRSRTLRLAAQAVCGNGPPLRPLDARSIATRCGFVLTAYVTLSQLSTTPASIPAVAITNNDADSGNRLRRTYGRTQEINEPLRPSVHPSLGFPAANKSLHLDRRRTRSPARR